MVKRALVTLIVVALATSLAVYAGSGTSEGRYAIHNTSVDTVELPGGGAVQVSHYKQFTYAADPNHPIDDTAADCVSVVRVDAAGNATSASGSCFGTDGQGNGYSFWWRQDEAGTDSCPTQCGSWGYFDGYGEYQGISGSGTWTATTAFPDGSSGAWQGSWSMP